jgi:hypothetical protein
MPSLVSGFEYVILLGGLAAAVIYAAVAVIVKVFRGK